MTIPLRDGGSGAQAYAEAVSVYLAFAVDQACRLLVNNMQAGNSRWKALGTHLLDKQFQWCGTLQKQIHLAIRLAIGSTCCEWIAQGA